MKKRTLKRFGAVLCAFAICLFSVFGVSSLFSKKDNNVISASAEEYTKDDYNYYIRFPVGFALDWSSSFLGFTAFSFYFPLNDGSYIPTALGYSYASMAFFGSEFIELDGTQFYFELSTDNTYATLTNRGNNYLLLDFMSEELYNLVFPVGSADTVSFSYDGSEPVFVVYLGEIYPTYLSAYGAGSVTVERVLKTGGGYTQEDLDNAREIGYNSGYALGQLFGKAEGEIIGQNNAGVNSSELFAGVKANLYVRSGEDLISSGLNVDVSHVVDDFYPNLPLWQLQITDGVISKDSTDTYVLELLLPIYVKYPSNTLYLGAGANATGVVGRVTGVSGYLYPQKQNYDGGVVTAPLPAGFENFYNIKSVAFTNPPTEDYYLSSVMISFTANPVRDSSFLLTLTTQELLNDYINTFNESYTTGEKVGYDEGKTVGYNEGVEDAHTYTFLNLMVAVIDAPIKSFTGMLDFEILGMNMRAFFLSLLTSALVIAAYRLFSGGKA